MYLNASDSNPQLAIAYATLVYPNFKTQYYKGMKPETRNVLLKAYAQIHKIVEELYEAHDRAIENNDLDDASLLASRADKLYEEVENLEIVITELEDR